MKETLCTREQYETWYRQSLDDPEAFWSSIAQDLYFHKPWEKPFMRYASPLIVHCRHQSPSTSRAPYLRRQLVWSSILEFAIISMHC